MTCKNCGAPLAENERYCPQCGLPVPPPAIGAAAAAQSSVWAPDSEDGTILMGGRQPQAQSPHSEDGTVLMGRQQPPASEGETVFFSNSQLPGTVNLPPVSAKSAGSPKRAKQKGQNYESSNIGLTIKGKIALVIGVIAIAVFGVLFYLDFVSRKTAGELLADAASHAAEADYLSAEEQYKKVIAAEPANAAAYLGYAELCLMRNDLAAAVDILRDGYLKTNSDELFKRCSELEDRLYGTSE